MIMKMFVWVGWNVSILGICLTHRTHMNADLGLPALLISVYRQDYWLIKLRFRVELDQISEAFCLKVIVDWLQ